MLEHHDLQGPIGLPNPGLSHVKALARGLLTARGQRKRDRTHARLLWATASVLDEQGYERTRVADIAAVAGVSPGAFYAYFVDREEAMRRCLAQFVEQLFVTETLALAGGTTGLRQAIFAELAFARANRGLLRALGQAIETAPALGDLLARRCAAWVRWADSSLEPAGLDQAVQGVLEAMICGAQRRMADRRVTEVELRGLAEAMARTWWAARTTSVEPARIN